MNNIFQNNPQLYEMLQQFGLLQFDFNNDPSLSSGESRGRESGEASHAEGRSHEGSSQGEHGGEGLVFESDGRSDSDPAGHHSRESEGYGHDSDGDRDFAFGSETDGDARHAGDADGRESDPAGHHSRETEGFGHDSDIDWDGDLDASHAFDTDLGNIHATGDMDFFIA